MKPKCPVCESVKSRAKIVRGEPIRVCHGCGYTWKYKLIYPVKPKDYNKESV